MNATRTVAPTVTRIMAGFPDSHLAWHTPAPAPGGRCDAAAARSAGRTPPPAGVTATARSRHGAKGWGGGRHLTATEYCAGGSIAQKAPSASVVAVATGAPRPDAAEITTWRSAGGRAGSASKGGRGGRGRRARAGGAGGAGARGCASSLGPWVTGPSGPVSGRYRQARHGRTPCTATGYRRTPVCGVMAVPRVTHPPPPPSSPFSVESLSRAASARHAPLSRFDSRTVAPPALAHRRLQLLPRPAQGRQGRLEPCTKRKREE